jgi:hypothetical protein
MIKYSISTEVSWALMVVILLSGQAHGVQLTTIPVGTVIPLRMETHLSSESSRPGDVFTASVFRDVLLDGRVAIPMGSRVEGRVTQVTRAERRSRAGTIAIAFDRLVLLDGHSISVDGTLTTLDEEARKKLEADEEGRVEGDAQKRRAVIFIGGGAGVGAVIGAITGGGKGAAVGAGVGAVLGTIGTLLSRGDEAEVKQGTEFGMMVERSFSVRERRGEPSAQFADSPESVRGVQERLRDRGYYTGPIDGRMSSATRAAIREFQRDRRLAVTGEIDTETARELGVIGQSRPSRGEPVSIRNPRAEWVDNDSVRIWVDAYTEGGGWQVFTDHFARAGTLHVYVQGMRPRLPSTTGRDHHAVSETFDNVAGVTRAIFHGSEREIIVEIARGRGPSPGGDTGDPRQITLLANRLLTDFQRDLNVRGGRTQLIFDQRRDYRQGEIDLLSLLNSLVAAAELYSQTVGRVRDDDAVKDAADALFRQARFVTRLLRRADGWSLSRLVQNDWEQLRAELRRITIVSSDLDTDIDRIR